MDLIERFRYIMKLNNMTASQFADEINVQRSSVSHILSGRNKPSLEFIQKVVKRFPKVDASWLISGSISTGTDKAPEVEKKQEKQVEKKIEESRVVQQVDVPVSNNSTKSIKKVLIFYTDGTFEEFSSINS